MEHIGDHIKKRDSRARSKETERGELMLYFKSKLNRSRAEDGLPLLDMARIGKILEGIPTKDLYYLKNVCDDAKNFSKKFWWEVKPENHKKDTESPF